MNNYNINNNNMNLYGDDRSKNKLNNQISNAGANVNRTPLQPRHLNKNYLNNENNFKFSTPLKLSNTKAFINPTISKNNTNKKNLDDPRDKNISDVNENENENDVTDMINDMDERNEQYYYNLKKNHQNDDTSEISNIIKLAEPSEIHISEESVDLNAFEEYDYDQSLLNKAYDFLENENIIYINMIDIKNREKINSYLAEGLFFGDYV